VDEKLHAGNGLVGIALAVAGADGDAALGQAARRPAREACGKTPR